MKTVLSIVLSLCFLSNIFAQGRDSISYFDPHLHNFDPHEMVQYIRPPYLDEYLNNPHKGTTSFQRLAGEALYPGLKWDDGTAPLTFEKPSKKIKEISHYPPTRIAYIRWKWADLEPEKGKIHFEIIENALKAAAERHQTLQVRFQPFTAGNTPDWYWNTGARVDQAFKDWYGYATPDHNDLRYIEHWGAFIKALGERFDGHPNLESVDLAYGGDWGEMGGNASYETARRLVDIYYEAFPATTLILMAGSPGAEYASEQTDRIVGWRADCFGDFSKHGWRKRDTAQNNWNHMYVAYPTLYELDGLKEKWQTAPVILETCGTVASWYEAGYDIDKILETGLRFHASVFMPKSVKIPEVWMEKIMDFNKKLGYRFYIHNMTMPKRATPGKEIRISTIIDNEGVAPIYKKYTFAIRLTQGEQEYIYHSNQDITTWMPFYTQFTEVIKVPATFQKGMAKISCAIVDAKNKPVVKFAIRDIDSEGWHPLAAIALD
ncbi:DUF4832 domain-containing protein [Fulvivirgaceae bacterium BMA12]|uniref:DUF4832 domain-containing protein n=1 Tax=Agaribacillus aureus TaxID=3051825 RepID=A0ABT8L212_9BACT|nr:DUF4832 domain-containing protein [Fulvivirgaceae bacterium BMA12]